ncbi:MAG: single-stranded DNA-binding protein, partial [Spirochaetes bacterium]|nr:single-stranded DNA-binding protein [Spirochaetota bacterium]
EQLNESFVEGRLTREPELLYTKNGHSLCSFDIAVNKSFKIGEEWRNTVNYFSVKAWNKLADTCSKYLKKGSLVRIHGNLKQETWENKEGRKRSKVLVEAKKVNFLNSKQEKKEEVEAVPVF